MRWGLFEKDKIIYMSILNWLLGRKKRQDVQKEVSRDARFRIPIRNYNTSLTNAEQDDEYERRKKRKQQEDSDWNNSLLNPMNPLSPLWYGNQQGSMQDNSNTAQTQSNDFGGGDFGGGGAKTEDWGSSSGSSSYDSGSSSDSSSYSSDSSGSGGGDF